MPSLLGLPVPDHDRPQGGGVDRVQLIAIRLHNHPRRLIASCTRAARRARLYGSRSPHLRIGCTYGLARQRPLSIQHAGVAGLCAKRHFDRAAHRVDHAAKLDDAAVASPLDGSPTMGGDGGVDKVAAQAPEPRERTVLVGSGEPGVADDVGHQDRRELSSLAHGANAEA